MNVVKVIGTPLYQWEIGRKLQIHPNGRLNVASVHFSHVGDVNALVVEPIHENGVITANIPNILLQSDANIVVYIVDVSEDHVETLRECVLGVNRRAKPSDYVYTETEVRTYTTLEKRIRDLEEGSGGITQESDPTVPAWAKEPQKPTYTAEEVGAASAESVAKLSEEIVDLNEAAVKSVNGVKPNENGNVQVEGGGSGGVYELIETITVDEETAEITMTQEPDGTRYNFKAMALRVTAPVSASLELWVQAHVAAWDYVTVTLSAFANTDAVRKSTILLYDKFGYWYAEGYLPSTQYGSSRAAYALSPNQLNKIPASKPMNKLWISTYPTAAIPIGTIIEIWGVRA